jgi:uncharacterized protein YkwD
MPTVGRDNAVGYARLLHAAFDLTACGLLALMVPPASVAQTPPVPSSLESPCQGSDTAFAEKAEALIAVEIGDERSKYAPSAPALRPDSQLTRVAQRRSCDMAHGADFSHTDAKGNFIAGGMVHQIFSPYRNVAENITKLGEIALDQNKVYPSFGPEEFASAAVDAWMKSPEHRANVLNAHFRASGIGVAIVDGQAFATQVFGGF